MLSDAAEHVLSIMKVYNTQFFNEDNYDDDDLYDSFIENNKEKLMKNDKRFNDERLSKLLDDTISNVVCFTHGDDVRAEECTNKELTSEDLEEIKIIGESVKEILSQSCINFVKHKADIAAKELLQEEQAAEKTQANKLKKNQQKRAKQKQKKKEKQKVYTKKQEHTVIQNTTQKIAQEEEVKEVFLNKRKKWRHCKS